MQQPPVIWGVLVALLFGAIGFAFWLFSKQPGPATTGWEADLPSSVDGWQRAAGSQHYDPETIFAYIDGHAEVYLAYGMLGCEAGRYVGPDGEPDLILDIFEMASPADAFGVFTHDTEGDPVGIGRDSRYRYGWLSFWQGSHFVSIVVEGESERAEEAALDLGRQVAALLPGEGSEPAILSVLPQENLVAGSVRYFHHPQILSTHLPIDPENSLDVGMDTPAVLGTYERATERAYLLVVDYPNEERAERAEATVEARLGSRAEEGGEADLETGFADHRREGKRMAVVLETSPGEWTTSLLEAVFD